MKKLMMICGLLFATVTFANAQQGGGQGQRKMMTSEDRVKQLDELVKLTDDQKTKANAVYTALAADQKKSMEEMMAGGTPDREKMMEARMKFAAETDTKISAILTDAQKTVYKAWADDMKAKRDKMMKERQAGGTK